MHALVRWQVLHGNASWRLGARPDARGSGPLRTPGSAYAPDLRYIGQFYTYNGISNQVAYVYLATGVELGPTHREPTELMEIRLVPVKEALRMAREGEITNGPSALAQNQPIPDMSKTLSRDVKRSVPWNKSVTRSFDRGGATFDFVTKATQNICL